MSDIHKKLINRYFPDKKSEKQYKEELINILQEKLNNIHTEEANTEYNFCFSSGKKKAIEEVLEIIKNY